MPILLKSFAGLFAGVVVGTVSLALWLPDESNTIQTKAVAARPVVEQPQFVAAPAPTGLDKAALDKLAQAMGAGGQPNPADPAATPTRGLDVKPTDVSLTGPNDETLRLRAQGLVALADGDVAEARAFLERAADAGDARSLLVLGDTYDPTTLARLGAIGIKGDVARARAYYARAREVGLVAARPRLAAAEIMQ